MDSTPVLMFQCVYYTSRFRYAFIFLHMCKLSHVSNAFPPFILLCPYMLMTSKIRSSHITTFFACAYSRIDLPLDPVLDITLNNCL
jgi:hypothetical protein